MKVGIAFDLAPTDPALRQGGPDDQFEEFDRPETVEAIAQVIRGEGHDVILLGDGREFLTRVLADLPDFVFNIAEGEGVGRCREARVPAVLEMLGIPYSGSDPLTLSVSLDKWATKLFVDMVDVPLSTRLDTGSIADGREAILEFCSGIHGKDLDEPLPYPLILKPVFEGSSKGIREDCLVDSAAAAISLYERLAVDYRQPILVEQFIAGDEVTVGLIGNGHASHAPNVGVQVIGVMKVVPKRPVERFVYSLEVKRDWAERVEYEAPARLSELAMRRTQHAAKVVFNALGCRDLARIDFRVRDDVPYFIEANPLPGLAPGTSDLVILARGHGIEYPVLIRRIFHAALTRVNLK